VEADGTEGGKVSLATRGRGTPTEYISGGPSFSIIALHSSVHGERYLAQSSIVYDSNFEYR
jgi:hypothetical protein